MNKKVLLLLLLVFLIVISALTFLIYFKGGLWGKKTGETPFGSQLEEELPEREKADVVVGQRYRDVSHVSGKFASYREGFISLVNEAGETKEYKLHPNHVLACFQPSGDPGSIEDYARHVMTLDIDVVEDEDTFLSDFKKRTLQNYSPGKEINLVLADDSNEMLVLSVVVYYENCEEIHNQQ